MAAAIVARPLAGSPDTVVVCPELLVSDMEIGIATKSTYETFAKRTSALKVNSQKVHKIL